MEFNKSKSDIFGGWLYPLVLAVLALIGSLFALEVYTILISIVLVSVALWTSDSIRPLLFFLITISYHLPAEHLYPSDYYYTGNRPYLLLGGIALFFISLGVFILKNRVFENVKIGRIPLFVPLVVLSVGMLLNGIGSADYKPMNLVWSGLMMVVYFFLYILIYLGMGDEKSGDMVSYLTYMTLLTAWILIIQMGKIYFVDGVVVNGVIDRGRVEMGYGVCNLVGFHISTLIPISFYGFMKGKAPGISIFTAFLLWVASVATTSRNAALVGTLYFLLCFVIAMFYGKRKVAARIIGAVALVLIGGCAAYLMYYDGRLDEIASEPVRYVTEHAIALIDQYIHRGLGSSGRTDIWKECVGIFKDNPIFGTGFFGMQVSEQFVPEEFIPEFAHNTVFELIAATGIVGTLCYGFYRLATLRIVFRDFSFDRFMIFLGASVLIAESMFDNYVFQIYTTFYYVIALAVVVMMYENREA